MSDNHMRSRVLRLAMVQPVVDAQQLLEVAVSAYQQACAHIFYEHWTMQTPFGSYRVASSQHAWVLFDRVAC